MTTRETIGNMQRLVALHRACIFDLRERRDESTLAMRMPSCMGIIA